MKITANAFKPEVRIQESEFRIKPKKTGNKRSEQN